jgi:hypothetical protein
MKHVIPDEIISLYGILAVSRLSAKNAEEALSKLPDVVEVLEKTDTTKSVKARISISDLDVENSGYEDELQDWLYKDFENLIPKWPPKTKPVPPIADIPTIPNDTLCDRIRGRLFATILEIRTQTELAEGLETLIEGFGKNAHPLVQIFAALFKVGLAEVRDRIATLEIRQSRLQLQSDILGCDPINEFVRVWK